MARKKKTPEAFPAADANERSPVDGLFTGVPDDSEPDSREPDLEEFVADSPVESPSGEDSPTQEGFPEPSPPVDLATGEPGLSEGPPAPEMERAAGPEEASDEDNLEASEETEPDPPSSGEAPPEGPPAHKPALKDPEKPAQDDSLPVDPPAPMATLAEPVTLDLELARAPMAQPATAPLALVAPDPTVQALEERLRKLESLLGGAHNLQAMEQRVAERVTSQLHHAVPAIPVQKSGLFERASGALASGAWWLPGFLAGGRTSLVWEILADLRAILRMYVDPRYSASWLGRILPPILLAAWLLAGWWVPFSSLPAVGWFIQKLGEILVAFVLFKVLGHEARRYRETAPDLPASLRP